MASFITIGTCSNCGGPVQIPGTWMGVEEPPVPQCKHCGAFKADPYGRTIVMDAPKKGVIT